MVWLADEVQQLIIRTTIANHFEREEALFKRGIKALSLFFIDSVAEAFVRRQATVLRDVLSVSTRRSWRWCWQRRPGHGLPRLHLERTQSRDAGCS